MKTTQPEFATVFSMNSLKKTEYSIVYTTNSKERDNYHHHNIEEQANTKKNILKSRTFIYKINNWNVEKELSSTVALD